MRDQLIAAMQNAIEEVRQWPQKEVQIFHHNDSDGLSSGAILTRTFERAGYDIRRFCLEKPYPALLQKLYEQEGAIIIFADFAGRIAPMLSDLNQGRNLTLILDHHVAEASTDPKVHNLDPDLFGLKGDRDIAGATTCYLFAHTWNPANKDLAVNAAIGAVGEGDAIWLDESLVSMLTPGRLEEAIERERRELESKLESIRAVRSRQPLDGRTLVVVDDGIATGSTVRAALLALRGVRPAACILAVPVGPPETIVDLAGVADTLVCPMPQAAFHSVGQWYDTFGQVSTREVLTILERHQGGRS